MKHEAILLLLAYLVDLAVGDPAWLPHPVVLMGKCITRLERLLEKGSRTDKAMRLKGCLFPLFLVGGSFLLCKGLLLVAYRLSPWLGDALQVWLLSTTIATKGLAKAGREVYTALAAGDLSLARLRLSYIVGRDTADLPEAEVVRASIETVAENIVDAVTTPLFFAFLGGAPLAMAYRAANTLDSMVGYKNERYLHLGWASARLDDLANYLPARLTLPFVVFAAWLLRFKGTSAWQIACRDAKVHPSPNSGFAEAAVAGALGIRLGGLNYYQGIPSFRDYMGDALQPTRPRHILQAIQILYLSTTLYLLVFASLLDAI